MDKIIYGFDYAKTIAFAILLPSQSVQSKKNNRLIDFKLTFDLKSAFSIEKKPTFPIISSQNDQT